MKAILYSRYSPRPAKKKTSADGSVSVEVCESCERQEEICRAWCVAKGWTVAGAYSDRGLSGKTDDRPGLREAMEHAAKVKGVLVCYCLSRFARSTAHCARMAQELQAKGCLLVSVKENIDLSSPSGRLLMHMLGAFAEFEREMIVERTSTSMLMHQQAGRRMSDLTPYGFRRDPTNPALMVADDVEQAVIRTILALALDGVGQREIARRLTAEGVTSRRGGAFDHKQVARVLRRAGHCTAA